MQLPRSAQGVVPLPSLSLSFFALSLLPLPRQRRRHTPPALALWECLFDRNLPIVGEVEFLLAGDQIDRQSRFRPALRPREKKSDQALEAIAKCNEGGNPHAFREIRYPRG